MTINLKLKKFPYLNTTALDTKLYGTKLAYCSNFLKFTLFVTLMVRNKIGTVYAVSSFFGESGLIQNVKILYKSKE
jgi:hypothetical protein